MRWAGPRWAPGPCCGVAGAHLRVAVGRSAPKGVGFLAAGCRRGVEVLNWLATVVLQLLFIFFGPP